MDEPASTGDPAFLKLSAFLFIACTLLTGCNQNDQPLSARDAVNQFEHRGRLIAEASDDERVAIGGDGLIVVNRVDDRLLWRFELPSQPYPTVDCIAWSRDGKYLAAAQDFGPIFVWNSANWKVVGKTSKADQTLTLDWRGDTLVAVRETGRRFTAEQWSVSQSRISREITAPIMPLPKASITRAEFLPNADRLLIATDYKIFLADWQAGIYKTTLLHANDDGIDDWDYCPENDAIVYSMLYGYVVILPLNSNPDAEPKQLASRKLILPSIKVSEDGKLLAVAGYVGLNDLSRIDVLRLDSGEVVHSVEPSATLIDMVWSDNDKALHVLVSRPDFQKELLEVPIPKVPAASK